MHRLVKRGLFIALLLAATLFTSNRLFFFKSGLLEETAACISYPFIQLAGIITSPIKRVFQHKQTYNQLLEDYTKLQHDYDTILAQTVQLSAQLHFAENIRELSEFAQRYNMSNALMAKVLVKNISDREHYFLINRGRRDGVTQDMVAVYNSHIVGRVSHVYYWYSKVRLISDQHSKIAARCSNTNAPGIVQGQNNCRKLSLTYVSHLLDIERDDLVISSGQGLVFPEGFCLGKVIHHEKKEKALYHSIYLEPQIDLEKLSTCLLLDQNQIDLF